MHLKPIRSRKFEGECRSGAAQHGLTYEVVEGSRHTAHVFKLATDQAAHCTLFTSRIGEVSADVLRHQREYLKKNMNTNEVFCRVLALHNNLCRGKRGKRKPKPLSAA